MEQVAKILRPKESASPEFPVWESYLVGRLGVGRERLLEMRLGLLVEGVDWIKQGRRVCLSNGAVEKLAAEMGLRAEKRAGEGMGVLPEPVARPVFTFKVYGKKVSHPNLILATDGARVVRVRVKTKGNFLVGMEIRCEHETHDLYNHVGNCPRFRGRY